jgi:hypothetical protein
MFATAIANKLSGPVLALTMTSDLPIPSRTSGMISGLQVMKGANPYQGCRWTCRESRSRRDPIVILVACGQVLLAGIGLEIAPFQAG